MKKIYLGAYTLCTVLSVSAQEVLWQKDIKSSTQALVQGAYVITIKTNDNKTANAKLMKK